MVNIQVEIFQSHSPSMNNILKVIAFFLIKLSTKELYSYTHFMSVEPKILFLSL